MNRFHWLAMSMLLSAVVLVGCKRDASQEKIYDVKGQVAALDVDKKTVVLDHEDIPGFMKAMKMTFSVETAKVLVGIQAGDRVQGKLKVKDGDYILINLQKR